MFEFHEAIVIDSGQEHSFIQPFHIRQEDANTPENGQCEPKSAEDRNDDPFRLDIDNLLSGTALDLVLGLYDGDDGKEVQRGTRGDNEMEGDYRDVLLGLGGDDVLSTADGHGYNELEGGRGNDELTGNHHDDLDGGAGNDILSTAEGGGYNELEGGRGDDILQAGHHDILYGGAGNDLFEFYGGHNTATGGRGADIFEIADSELPYGPNIITDFHHGQDTLSIRNIEGLESFDDLSLTQEGRNVVVSFDGDDIAVLEKMWVHQIDAHDFVIEPLYTTNISAADFDGAPVTNPYLPLIPGSVWVYEGQTEEGLERNVVEVLNETKMINGVEATVIRDTVYLDGEIHEQTFDWYAQDKDGNVWYLGEDVTNFFENGQIITKSGSFEWGVDGALPGIIMYADPVAHLGETYNQEFYIGEAEDKAELLSTTETVSTPYGTFGNVLKSMEFSPLDHTLRENKYYAEGIGFVKAVSLTTGEELSLIEFTPGGTL